MPRAAPRAPDSLRRVHVRGEQYGDLKAHNGYCSVTGDASEVGCSATDERRQKGFFRGVDEVFPSVWPCIAHCKECSACHYISYSRRFNDCSWYAAGRCKLNRLQSKNSEAHQSFAVRHESNGSMISEVDIMLTQWREQEKLGAAKCAVVGSSSTLLSHTHGPTIDAHDAVFRVNLAPTWERYRKHVGQRTTVRVWGDQTMPDEGPRSDDYDRANETVVVYCGPVHWVGACWTTISVFPRPRFSPFAWQEVATAIHGGPAALPTLLPGYSSTYPTSGAMAIWLALSLCRNVSVFGFGSCDHKAAGGGGGKAGGGGGGKAAAAAVAAPNNSVYYDPTDTRNKMGFAMYHNFTAEWRWIRRLHRKKLLTQVC